MRRRARPRAACTDTSENYRDGKKGEVIMYYVINDENFTSVSDDDEGTVEVFKDVSAARARAIALARAFPVKVYTVCMAIETISCPIGAPVSTPCSPLA